MLPLIAAAIAIWGVLTHRAMVRRSNTMQHIADCEADRDVLMARDKFIELSTQAGGLAVWAAADKESSKETAAIRLILNDFELVAVGIQHGIIDFEFYRRYCHGTIIRYWQKSAPFIHALRERVGSQTIYSEFEQLYDWVNTNKKPKRNIIWKKLF